VLIRTVSPTANGGSAVGALQAETRPVSSPESIADRERFAIPERPERDVGQIPAAPNSRSPETDPAWWPEFEREFEAYLKVNSRKPI
jgi:hypothetical protein